MQKYAALRKSKMIAFFVMEQASLIFSLKVYYPKLGRIDDHSTYSTSNLSIAASVVDKLLWWHVVVVFKFVTDNVTISMIEI